MSWIEGQYIVVRDSQTLQLKVPSILIRVLFKVDVLGLEKFCLNLKILHEYMFFEIGFKILKIFFLILKFMTMLYLTYLFIWSGWVWFFIVS